MRLLAVGEKLLAMDSDGVRWYFSSLKGAALVHEAGFIRGGFSRLFKTSCKLQTLVNVSVATLSNSGILVNAWIDSRAYLIGAGSTL